NPISGVTGSAHGNVFDGGNVVPFAQGGVVDSPTLAPMALFGEAGPEAIVPLRRDGSGNLGIASSSGGARAPDVIINKHTQGQPQASVGNNGDVPVTLRRQVDAMTGDSLSSGTGRRVLKSQFGIKPFMPS